MIALDDLVGDAGQRSAEVGSVEDLRTQHGALAAVPPRSLAACLRACMPIPSVGTSRDPLHGRSEVSTASAASRASGRAPCGRVRVGVERRADAVEAGVPNRSASTAAYSRGVSAGARARPALRPTRSSRCDRARPHAARRAPAPPRASNPGRHDRQHGQHADHEQQHRVTARVGSHEPPALASPGSGTAPGRVEALPADAREVHLGPRVRVALAHDEPAGESVARRPARNRSSTGPEYRRCAPGRRGCSRSVRTSRAGVRNKKSSTTSTPCGDSGASNEYFVFAPSQSSIARILS